MEVLLLDTKKITKLRLPSKVEGVYTLKYTPVDSCYDKDIYIEALDGKWILKSNPMIEFSVNKKVLKNIELKENVLVEVSLYDSLETVYLYCVPNLNEDYARYINNFNKIKFGSTNQCSVLLKKVKDEVIVCEIYKENNVWHLYAGNSKANVYVNNHILNKECIIHYGDVIFVEGLRIILMRDFVQINGISCNFELDSNTFMKLEDDYDNTKFDKGDECLTLNKNTSVLKEGKFKKENIESETITILLPPKVDKNDDNVFIIFMVSFVLLVVSLVGFCNLSMSFNTNSQFVNIISLIITILIMVMVLLLPFGYYIYKRRVNIKKENERDSDYTKYLENCTQKIDEIILSQEKKLNYNYPAVSDYCTNMNNDIVWSRKIDDDDFLNLRLGIGNHDALLNVSAADNSFTFDNDILLKEMYKLIDKKYFLKNVPIMYNFTGNKVTSLNIDSKLKRKFLELLIAQIATLHSPANLKLSFFLRKDEFDSCIKLFPHVFSDDRIIRYYAKEDEEMKVISDRLIDIFDERIKTMLNNVSLFNKVNPKKKYSCFGSYYLIFVDDVNVINDFDIFGKIINFKQNVGFSIVYVGDKNIDFSNCSINITDESYIWEKDIKLKTYFEADDQDMFNPNKLLKEMLSMADFNHRKYNLLPTPLSFLKLYDITYIEQLNLLDRWRSNDTSVKLSTFIGEKKNSSKFILDTSDNVHGPHGLIIGEPADGKSEFLMTFILSMCINYTPRQVQFVILEKNDGKLYDSLSDGKYTIPHLLKVYNEFDLIDYQGILKSISDELKYREKLFTEAIDLTNDVAMDIYKYQNYYRKNLLKEELAHLYFIIDDLDELSEVSPTFINELLSIIRVGHLFGIHLIASLKDERKITPLDDLMDRLFFKVKLDTRVNSLSFKDIGMFQLYSKNKNVLEVGRFAYTNIKYDPYDSRQKKDDTSVLFIDNIGRIIESSDECLRDSKNKVINDEKTMITRALIDWSKNNSIVLRKLGKEKKKGVKNKNEK